jgi:exopolysaccharide production protein ExoQ
MAPHWQSAAFKVSSLPWITFFLLIGLFFLIEPQDMFRPISHQPGYYSDSGQVAEIIAENTAKGTMARRVGLVMLGLFGIFSLWKQGVNKIQINGFLGYLLIFFLCWATLSIFWAKDVPLTFRRVVILWVLWLGALGFARRHSLNDLVWLAFIGSAFILVTGIIVEIAWGVFHPFATDYRFAGTLHPNHQSWACAVLLISSMVFGGKGARGRLFFLLAGLLALSLLLLTKSRIATASAIFALAIYWYFNSSRTNKALIIFAVASFSCFLIIFLQDHLANFMRTILVMGRTDNYDIAELSGRISLWKELFPYIFQRFFTGYGFNAFWTPDKIMDISEQLYWGVPGAHSGIMELILGIGIIGAGLYLLILLLTIKELVKSYQVFGDRVYLFSLILLIFYSSVMLAEEIFSTSCFPGFIVSIILIKFGLTAPKSPLFDEAYQGQLSREFSLT